MSKGRQIYQFEDYRGYLTQALEARGEKLRFSNFLNCQQAYLSRVMAGLSEFSLEQAMKATEFLELTEMESDYFMLLVHYEKSGTGTLKSYYQKKIEAIRAQRNELSSRLKKPHALGVAEQNIFYTTWIYGAIHVLASIKQTQTRKAIRDHLKMPATAIDPIIDFLVQTNLLIEKDGILAFGNTRIHLDKSSPLNNKAHVNWRLRTIQALEVPRENDFHYSLAMSISKKDVEKIRAYILETIEKTETTLKESGEEVAYLMNIDLLQL